MQTTVKQAVASAPSAIASFPPANRWKCSHGVDYVVIEPLEEFEPFFLGISGAGDQWLFCSSHGSLTAGRQSAERALFPYYTVDKIIGNWNTTGPWTAIATNENLWNPFSPSIARLRPIRRRLMKSTLGDEIVFEEEHLEMGLRMSYRWRFSQRFGFVRSARLVNEGPAGRRLRLVDGLDNFMPAGIESRFQLQFSCLADAYKISEQDLGGALVIHRLAAGITDEPAPLEMLHATTVWCTGLGGGPTFMDRRDAEAFLRGAAPTTARQVRGRRGAMFLARDLFLEAGDALDWTMVAEIQQSQSDIAGLRGLLADPGALLAEVENDIRSGSGRLASIVAAADGFQQSADRDIVLHHYHNTLANILRGGIPENGCRLDRGRFLQHLSRHNAELATHHAEALSALPGNPCRDGLLEAVRAIADPDLDRIATEYLPLILSRRHGDPSRPWNRFFIRVADDDSGPVHHFEGNWRDIFQNWEALAWSYPEYLDAFVAKFLNASTIDGFNPYRITSEGIDWEAPMPDDPWASIGYWGDHQIVYLLKLLELEARVHPDRLAARLDIAGHVYADVPYRLVSWEKTLEDPRDTVVFDHALHAELMERKARIGADGLLLRNADGSLVRATLAEKLLLPALTKLANLIPGGGIWLNTRRPEWNDANNALAGCGLSVVTAGYLYRYLGCIGKMIAAHPHDTLRLSPAICELLETLGDLFGDPLWTRREPLDAGQRFNLVRAAGLAVERYRRHVYQAGPGEPVPFARRSVLDFIEQSRASLETTLRQNRRDDTLWHSYNVLHIHAAAGRMSIERLVPMLEGQVSILSSGILDPAEAVDLLEALPDSPLRSSRHETYLLYPDRETVPFLETNRVDPAVAGEIPLLAAMTARGDQRLLVRDPDAGFRFHPDLVNVYALRERIARLAQESGLGDMAENDRSAVEALYEATFRHHSFTGRSGSMFAYEGLGCVYWHMVSKLMLAAQEVTLSACEHEADDVLIRRLAACYFDIQRGLGFRKTPEGYGAFPAEPYSHSPAHAGARQPGLTGQVKEGILCRLGELGVDFRDGRLRFRPRLLRRAEFGDNAAGSVGFTLAGTPVRYRLREDLERPVCRVHCTGSPALEVTDAEFDAELTREITGRSGRVQSVVIELPAAWTVV